MAENKPKHYDLSGRGARRATARFQPVIREYSNSINKLYWKNGYYTNLYFARDWLYDEEEIKYVA